MLTPNAAAAGGRLAFLDCLRAIAVLLVFTTHSTEMFASLSGSGRWLAWLAHGLDFGRVGVVVFFAISGFLIPSSLRGGVADGCTRFLVSRFFRLFPAFWVSILPAVLLQHWLLGEELSRHQVLLNFTMVPRLFGAPMANGAYWTLEVELLFYASCTLLFAAGQLRHGFVVFASAMFLGFVFYVAQGVWLGGLLDRSVLHAALEFLLHLSIMWWGASCRRMWDGERIEAPARLMFWLYSGYLLAFRPLGLAWHLLWRHDATVEAIQWCSGYSGAMWIFVLLVFVWPLRSRILAWTGRISYSFYLLHGPAIYLVVWLVQGHAGLRGGPMAGYLLASLALTLIFSQVNFTVIEAPFIARGRVVSRRLLARLGWAADAQRVPARPS